jgi:hypothetical protein
VITPTCSAPSLPKPVYPHCIAKLLELLNPEDEGCVILLKVENCLPVTQHHSREDFDFTSNNA